ncbi:preprotein translocase subunit SecA [Nanchangia anserum]|uniref:Protein translocase subunit SecA n=1 Tax=Nanchangia anserum TaxID=2692125 RepID=A0A8I0KS55_9ACTO|nr:preprotein translocase subunit SecA [Nanchangia anserum]
MSIFDKILRIGEGRTLRRFEALANEVIAKDDEYTAMSDDELKAMTSQLKAALDEGATLDEILVPAFATVREAAWRVLGQKPYPVQIVGAIALHRGNIAEMKTGEGKTLVATMPSYLNALTGRGVHVVTVNDYLASYQSELMGRVYRFLGMEVGCIVNGQDPVTRRKQYAADITYGTNNEFGFDYLRDNMVQRPEDLVQRDHHYAIVDEVDSILIDEARTPLIISGPAMGEADRAYEKFADLVRGLERDVDYEVDEKKRTVGILEAGIEKVEDYFNIDNLYQAEHTPRIGFLNNALKAKELFERDRDYIVRANEIIIVDEHTGRTMEGRRYSEGLHQAIEAKERVPVKAENQTLATITLQNYFRHYDKLAGMTGTAETEAAEFMSTFKIGVIPIPTNRPMARVDKTDLVYPTREGKLTAIVEDIAQRYDKGQPVLVGTTDVAKSEELSALLKKRRIPHNVLNAKEHEREAQIVFEAGRLGQVTIATNMAGRGTDIMLGGNPEHIADQMLRTRSGDPLDPIADSERWREEYPGALEDAKAQVAAEHEKVKELGGLYVLGTERHDSRRIDNQLRGRSGRQGDPGESRFYLSMEDPLMMRFASGFAQRIMQSGAYPPDMPLENKAVAKSIRSAQQQVEAMHFETRKNVLKYDDVMTDQRNLVYDQRRQVLEKDIDLDTLVPTYLEATVSEIVRTGCDGNPEEWNLESVWATLRSIYPISVDREAMIESAGGIAGLTLEDVETVLHDDITDAYDTMVDQMNANPLASEQLGEEPVAEMERRVLLATVDRLWQEHLYEMDYLREGIGLRAMGQRDPLVEYSSEGAHMFQGMMGRVREETVAGIFSAAGQFEAAYQARVQAEREAAEKAADAQAHTDQRAARSEAIAKSMANAPSVMGDTGTASRGKILGRSGAGGDGSTGGMNRAQRRAKKAKNKKRR